VQQQLSAALARSNANFERFASFLSHELRQPLSVIVQTVDALELGSRVPDTERVHAFGRLRRSADRIGGLIQAELELARLNRDGERWDRVDLGAPAGEARDALAGEIQAADADVTVGPLPTVEGNAVQLRQLFVNLVGNALRHGRPQTPLRIHIAAVPSEHDDRVRIEIADNGTGISLEHLERLFEVFVRGDDDARGGYGLGLAICKRIAERHRGRLTVRSDAGSGTTFTLELPRADS
jgi:signal transduction histidine kinase